MTDTGKDRALHLSLHGVSLSLESELEAFASYVGKAMEPFRVAASDGPRVSSRLEWVEGPPSRSLEQAFGVREWERRPDRDMYVSGSTVYWLRIDDFDNLQLALTWQGDRLLVRGRYHFQLGRSPAGERLRRLRHRGRLDVLRARRFSTLLYYLVYHPILWILSREQGWHVLHAGAVASGGRAVVFAGMPGCGKSTLAVAMTAEPGWTMLSDNLLLFDGVRVRACPELLLLDERSMSRVGRAADRIEATGERRVYAREAYRPVATDLDPLAPAALFNVGRAQRTELIAIDADACISRLAANNRLAKEVRRIAIMAEVLDLVSGRRAPNLEADLGRLAATTPCYDLWIEEGGDLAAVIREHVLPSIGAPNAAARARA